jgi:preprotein translocase subunit SecY
MFSAFTNIVKIPDLRHKVLITLGLLAVSRIGVFIPLPGVNLEAIRAMIEQSQDSAIGQLFGMLDMFSGGGLMKASIFALGIMPYISASIIFQLLSSLVPALQKVAKEGESGRRKITQWTRYSTVGLCMVQAIIVCSWLQGDGAVVGNQKLVLTGGPVFILQAMIILTTGTAFLMWLGEQIDEFGIGNGMSLIIMIGIASRLPKAIEEVARQFDPAIDAASSSAIGPGELFILFVLFIAMVTSVVYVTEATRRIPMQTPKRSRVGFRQQHYLPLKLNASGVIAIIFAQALMMLPNFLQMVPIGWVRDLAAFLSTDSFLYMAIYLLLIIFFSYFYTAVLFDPKEHAENFKQYGIFIPGIRPGNDTREYLERVITRITFAGAIFIAIIAIMPQIIQNQLKVGWTVSGFFGGTGLLIMVGVALDVLNRVESHLLMEKYEGFLRGGGRIRGRRG